MAPRGDSARWGHYSVTCQHSPPRGMSFLFFVIQKFSGRALLMYCSADLLLVPGKGGEVRRELAAYSKQLGWSWNGINVDTHF